MSLLKSGMVVAGGTLASRISGFARDILVAKYLGATDLADIWVAAFRFPNMFRRIIAEGAFNAAFMPVYSQASQQEGSAGADLFAGRILSRMTIIIGLATIICQLLMPYLVYLIAPGYSGPLTEWVFQFFTNLRHGVDLPAFPDLGYSEKISLTISLTIICLPYAGFMFLAAIQSAILNFHNKFIHASIVAVILNLTLIFAIIGSGYFNFSPLYGLGWGSFVAGLLQCFMLYRALVAAQLRLEFRKPVKDDYTKKFIKLFIPGLISGGVTQINLLVGSIVASFTSGAMAYLYYADRVYQLPLSLIGVSLSIVLLPSLIKSYQSHNVELAKNTLSRAIEFAAFSTLPAVFALIVIPLDIVTTLFLSGKFTILDAQATSNILMIYGLGLPAFIAIKLLSPAYYAHQNTKTPMIYASWSIVVNILMTLILFPMFNFYAIPIASIVAGWFNCMMLYINLYRTQVLTIQPSTYKIIAKIILCCLLMCGVLFGFKSIILGNIIEYNRLGTMLLILVGCLSYFGFCYGLEVIPRQTLKSYLKR